MNNQFKAQPSNDQPQKPVPTVEQSLKYMAWDVKGIVPAINALAAEIRLLRMGKSDQSGDAQENPF
jgi:hypothetical protein